MSFFYKSHYFAQRYWEGDEYWRPKAKVPAPVVPVPAGGGGGVWPWYRVKEEECAKWAKESAESFRKSGKWKKAPRLDPLEAIKKKKKISEIEKKNATIRKLNREIDDLRAQLDIAKKGGDELEKARRDSETRSTEKADIRKKLRWLFKLIATLNQKIEKLEKEREEQIKLEEAREKAKAAELAAAAAAPPIEVPPEDLATSAEEENPYWKEIADLEEKKRRFLAALPWAFGAGCTYLGARYLVSEDLKWLKVVGYVGTGVLATIAVFKLSDFDLGYWILGNRAEGMEPVQGPK